MTVDSTTPTGDDAPGGVVYRLEAEGLDRATAEMLTLELLRLAKLHGVDVSDVRIEPASKEPGPASR